MYDDGDLVHRDEGKAIFKGFTDGSKKSYRFANGCPRRVSEHQGSESHMNSNKKFNNNKNKTIKRHQLRIKGLTFVFYRMCLVQIR